MDGPYYDSQKSGILIFCPTITLLYRPIFLTFLKSRLNLHYNDGEKSALFRQYTCFFRPLMLAR